MRPVRGLYTPLSTLQDGTIKCATSAVFLVTDRQTDNDSIYHASIALRDKTTISSLCKFLVMHSSQVDYTSNVTSQIAINIEICKQQMKILYLR